MPNEPRIQSRDIPLTCAEPVYRDVQEASPRAVAFTTMTTSTINSVQITSAHIGYYAIPSDGQIRGQARQIKSFVGSPTYLATLDSAWNTTAGVSEIRLWQPPDIPIVGTSAGSTTTVVASAHASLTNEPDDYWNSKGYFLLGRNSTFAGGCYQETDFTSSTGTFQASGGLGATPGVGAFFDLRHLVRCEGPINATINQKTLTRRVVGFKEADAAVPITSEDSVEITLPVRPLTASAGNGTAATPPLDIRDYLQDMFTETLDTGDTVTGVSSNVVSYTDTSPTVGGFSLFSTGEAAQLVNSASSIIGSAQVSSTLVASGSTAYAAAWYKPKDSDFRTRTFDIYRGRLFRQLFHGCMPTIEINVSRDQLVTFAFKYTASTAFEYETSNPITSTTFPLPLIDQTVPTDGKGARFLIDGVKVLCGNLKINPGFTPVPRMSLSGANQTDGMAMDTVPTTGSFTALADINDISGFKALGDRLRSGDVVQVLYQKGTAPGSTFAIGMPSVQLTKVQFNFGAGQGEFQSEFVCQVPQISGAVNGLPGLAFGWL